jgi:hypothetical protein
MNLERFRMELIVDGRSIFSRGASMKVKVLQVFVGPIERQGCENGEDSTCSSVHRWRWRSAFPARERSTGFELKVTRFEPRKRYSRV